MAVTAHHLPHRSCVDDLQENERKKLFCQLKMSLLNLRISKSHSKELSRHIIDAIYNKDQ